MIFISGYIQIFLISINTYFISKGYLVGVLIVSFCISLLWTYNVRKVNVSTLQSRIVYALGAAMGGLSGAYLASIIV